MAKFKFVTGIGYVGCEEEEVIEIPDEELEGKSKKERFEYINSYYEDWVWQQVESSSYWKELEEE